MSTFLRQEASAALHFKPLGHVIGEHRLPDPRSQPEKIEYDEEAARLFGEQVYGKNYWERNSEYRSGCRSGAHALADVIAVGEPADKARFGGDVPF